MNKKTYIICIWCSDMGMYSQTEFEQELTDAEYELMKVIAKKSVNVSSYSPILEIEIKS